METINDVHQQFAEFFKSDTFKPFAYLVSKKLAEGHICLDLKDVEEELDGNLFYNEHEIMDAGGLLSEPLVTTKKGETKPFVLHNQKLYLQRYFHYETQILERLTNFAETEKPRLKAGIADIKKHGRFIKSLFEQSADGSIDWQLLAAISAVLNDFTIITGGPGTGKTTTVARVLAILYSINSTLKVALAAPTGKAAARMAESLKTASSQMPEAIRKKFESIVPGTIHRLLKFVYNSPYFRHNKENPLNVDVVIIDESSMIDAALFAKLLDAIAPQTKLIMLGDKDQLASVEAGSLFGDLCKSQAAFTISKTKAALINSLIAHPTGRITNDLINDSPQHILSEHIIELKKSHRFSSDKGIGKFSKAVINGDLDQLQVFLTNEDEQVTLDTDYNQQVFEDFIEGYTAYIREGNIKKALKKLNELRVLCAVREGDQGLYNINRTIEKYLQQKKLIKPIAEFYEHRPIIVTKNYYDLNLFNGDVGIIRYDESGILKAWFEDSSGELKSVLPGFIAEAETVYAMTIHKSQGSEYDKVMVVLPDADIPLLTAELLYTGVTRAKSKVIVQAPEEVIMETSRRKVKRASGIVERFGEIATSF